MRTVHFVILALLLSLSACAHHNQGASGGTTPTIPGAENDTGAASGAPATDPNARSAGPSQQSDSVYPR